MANDKVLICNCPDLKIDSQALVRQWQQSGADVSLRPPLCTPEGLIQWRSLTWPGHQPWIIAACEAARDTGFLELLAGGRPLPLVDILSCSDLETATAELLQVLTGRFPRPKPLMAPLSQDVLIIGGGVGGCQAALDLANAGVQVYLTDASLSIGGTMAQLDKTFPTLDCSICILGPKLVEVATHPKVELLTYGEVTNLTGEAGNFSAEIVLKPRYVDMDKCIGCGSCSEVCPVIIPSRWNLGLKPRKCIRIIFAQAVPLRATIEKEFCLDCRMCLEACERQAINLDDQAVTRHLKVGAIVVATGARPFDPTLKSEYGYGRLPAVVTNLEFERIVCATGPTQGNLLAPSGRKVQRLAFIQCVGSRDRRFLPYCSGYCCTASIKEAMLALEHHSDAEVYIFYNDIRTSGKGFEELYQRARQKGVRFIKGLPGCLEEGDSGQVVVVYEDQHRRQRHKLAVDLAVLAVGLQASGPPLPLPGDNLARDNLGFYQSRHALLSPLETTVPGIFLAGTCQGPKDISETVSQGSAAAGRVLNLLASLKSDR